MGEKAKAVPYLQKGSRERVTGATRFIDDLEIPHVLHGKFVRLSCGRAKIRQIDLSRAADIPGVVRIFTFNDFPEGVPRYGPLVMDRPVLADGIAKYTGDPVALVVGESEQDALEGARAVAVDYQMLPPILTREAALSPELALVHDPEMRPDSVWKNTNIMDEWDYRWGKVEGKEQGCALVLENIYRSPFVHHFALETHCSIGLPDSEGVTVLSAVQHPFLVRRVVATMLGLPQSKVRVQSIDMGGAFGCKGYPQLEPATALFAWLMQRPLKIHLSAEESFIMAQREAAYIHIRTGFDPQGMIVFQDIEADFLVGAYADISPRVISKSCLHATGPYRTPNARIRARGLFTTTPPTTAFRGFGNTHTVAALEIQMNEAAARLNMDPLELRRRNMRRRGDLIVARELPVDGDWAGALQMAADAIGWHTPKPEGHGRGIAFGMKSSIPGSASSARVSLNADASATVYVGTTEMGQGTRTALSLIVSKALDMPLERISIQIGDTGVVPHDTITASSRSVVNMGNALTAACASIKKQLKTIAAEVFGVEEEQVKFERGQILAGDREIPLATLMRKKFGLYRSEIAGEGTFQGKSDASHPLGGPAPFFEAVANAVELHVDSETGQVVLDKLVHVTDVGKAINPRRASGVDEGGNIIGVGVSLSEQLLYDRSGGIVNGSSLDYRIPTVADIPEQMISLFQENHDGPGPQGAKGLGEGGILAVAPAICGALFDCTGILFTEIPLTPEKIWRAMSKQDR